LSPTEIGTIHDKKIASEYPIVLPIGSVLRQDSGFIGHNPINIIVEQPFKKPIGKELTFSQLIYNQLLSPLRVVIEHANSGVKRLKIIKDIVRLHSTDLRDKIIAIACALHNFRVKSPLRNYQPSHVFKFIF
jgi:DDE superfamily endonuclease